MSMTATIILRNMSESFLVQLSSLDAETAWVELSRLKRDLPGNITVKIGSGQIRNAVELNVARHGGAHWATWKLEARKGYKLATFN